MAANTVMVRLDTLPQDIVDAILQAAEAPTLPKVTATDNDKFLGVSGGEWAVLAVPVELPAASGGSNGNLLGISGGKWAIVAAPVGLPAVTGDDEGKVLKVVDGAWAAVSEEAATES